MLKDIKYKLTVICVILALPFLPGQATGQFLGGNDDGVASINYAATIGPSVYCDGGQGDGDASGLSGGTVDPGIYYLGGNGDGETFLYATSTISEGFYLSGGNDDGIALVDTFSIMSLPIYCYGGDQDGFALAEGMGNTSGFAIYCFGGNEDGSARISANGLISPTFYCTGGPGDGQDALDMTANYLGLGLWNGYVNSNWNNAGNWTNSFVPDRSFKILIPGGCLNYPVISSDFSINELNWGDIGCARLDIQNGADFTTNGNLRINGIMNITGQFHHANASNGSFQLTDQGDVTVEPGGELLIQQ